MINSTKHTSSSQVKNIERKKTRLAIVIRTMMECNRIWLVECVGTTHNRRSHASIVLVGLGHLCASVKVNLFSSFQHITHSNNILIHLVHQYVWVMQALTHFGRCHIKLKISHIKVH